MKLFFLVAGVSTKPGEHTLILIPYLSKSYLADCAKDFKANLILRGLRAMSDFEYELQIAHTNKSLNSQIETIFLSTNTNYSFLSSSLVKEVAKFGGEINHMVPESV